MFNYLWPMVLVIITSAAYQLCTKSVPKGMNPFASLTVTYLIAAASSVLVFLITGKGDSLIKEFGKTNFTPVLLGFVIVALETGWIYTYKAGWQIGTSYIIHSAFLEAILLIIGFVVYHEAFSWNRIIGAVICLIGLSVLVYNPVR